MKDEKTLICRQYYIGCHTAYYNDVYREFKDGFTRKDLNDKMSMDHGEERVILDEMTDFIKNNYICGWCDQQFSQLINKNMPCWNDINLCKNEQGKNSKEKERFSGRVEYSASNKSDWKLGSPLLSPADEQWQEHLKNFLRNKGLLND